MVAARNQPASVEGREPPYDLDAEAATLSATLISEDAARQVVGLLEAGEFYSGAHRRIFEAVEGLTATDAVVNLVSVATWLKNHGRLAEVGGMGFLTELLNAAPAVGEKALVGYATTVREKAAIRRLIFECQATAARGYVEVADARAFVETHQKAVERIGAFKSDKPYERTSAVTSRVYAEFSERHRNRGAVLGVPTGFSALDATLHGLRSGKLYIVASRPGMGKSALTMQFAMACASWGHGAILFSLEMTADEIGERMICSRGEVSLSSAATGSFSAHAWQKVAAASADIASMPILIEETPGISFAELRSKVLRARIEMQREDRLDENGHPMTGKDGKPVKRELRLVVVDYLQLMRERAASREEAVSEITRGLKALAMELKIPIVAVSQLNREVEKRADKRPMLSDLRESGSIEQDADAVLLLFREGYYNKDAKKKDVAEAIVSKNRGGVTGVVELGWDGWRTSFRDLENREGGGA